MWRFFNGVQPLHRHMTGNGAIRPREVENAMLVIEFQALFGK